MGLLFQRDFITNKTPLTGDNRDERMIIDVAGNWIPECEMIYYGLLNSKYSEGIYRLRETPIIKPDKLYNEICYFNGGDLINYLCSSDVDNIKEMPEEVIIELTMEALSKYMYVPCSETMFRHAIIESAYHSFVQEIVLVYPWVIRPIDMKYIQSIIPRTVYDKFKFVSGKLDNVLETSGNIYTTIVSNSLDVCKKIIDNPEKYNATTAFILLRNHSGNTTIKKKESTGEYIFEEKDTLEIMVKVVDFKTGLPLSELRFARYEPVLFKSAMNKMKSSFIGG